MLTLREVQLRFFAALGARLADPTLLELIEGGGTLRPAERLDVYAGMYRTRLLDVLREDFPRTLAAVGDDGFAALACRCLGRFASNDASVRHLGHRFADFLATEPTIPAFLADLARLEWARVEVFDAADAVPLRLDDLRSVPPDAWPELRFRLIPACIVVESAWPIHCIWIDAAEPGACRPEPEATSVRVWREGWSVSHAAMGAAELQAFRALERGASLAAICAAVETDVATDTAAHEMGSIFMRWVEDGLLARAE